jgi:hypothetical protein
VLACVENRGELRWVVGCSLGGERWDGEEEGEEEGETEKERKRECRQRQYILDLPMASPTEFFVGDSTGVSDTSMFGCSGLNPSVFPSVNASEKNPCHPAVAISKKKFLSVG